MFPQEFIICFHKHVRIERFVIQSYFREKEKDLVHTEGHHQNEETVARDGSTTYLRFIIVSTCGHFPSVHSISAEGTVI
ncbi:intraflagellar transport protein 25 homolog isoform X2 [Callithrix jacchus]